MTTTQTPITIAGTGHRPDKLGGYTKDVGARLENFLTDYLRGIIMQEDVQLSIISGMALGFDQALARAAVNLGISLTAAIPFRGQENKWSSEAVIYYNWLLDKAAVKIYVSDPGYAPYKMQVRNEWMVDNCDGILALWDGSQGGTGNCVNYAKARNKPVVNLWQDWAKSQLT